MKTIMRSLLGFALLATLAAPTRGYGAARAVIVETMDFDKTEKLSVMTETAFKELQLHLRGEERAFPKAILEAKKVWSADEKYKGKSFPAGAFAPRRAMVKGPAYKDEAEAQAKLSKMEEQSARSEMRRADEEMRRQKELNRGQNKGQSKTQIRDTSKDHAAERKALEVEALALLKTKIGDVLTADPSKTEPKKADPVKPEPAKGNPGAKPLPGAGGMK